MNSEQALAVFEDYKIRRIYDETSETWYFSVVDIVAALIQQSDHQTARKYWNKLKERLGKEGSQSVTDCHRLKLPAADGKQYLTDVASPETLLRIIQSVPSPRAEPIKLWLAKVGYERIQDMSDPVRSLDRAREYWRQHGRSEKWIQQRMMGQETRNKLTDYWKDVAACRKTPRPAARAAASRKEPAWSWSRRPAGAWSPARISCHPADCQESQILRHSIMAEGGAGAERRMAEGVEKLSEAELLAIILRVGRGTFKRGIECDRRLRYGIEEVQR